MDEKKTKKIIRGGVNPSRSKRKERLKSIAKTTTAVAIAMDVLTVAAATERVLLVVTHPAMRAHIQWCESPEKERSGSLSRGGRVPD